MWCSQSDSRLVNQQTNINLSWTNWKQHLAPSVDRCGLWMVTVRSEDYLL